MTRCPVRHDFISHGISNIFAAYGRFLSRHPWIVLAVVTALGLFLCGGIYRLKVISLEMEDFTPQDSQALRDRVKLKEFEEIKNSGALPTDNGNETNCRYSEVVFVAKNNINLFTLKALIDILSVENQLWAEAVETSIPGVRYTYNQTCHRVNNACFGPTLRLFSTFVPQLRDLLNMDPAMATDPAFADFMEVSIIETGVELTYPYYQGQFIAATLSEVVFRRPRNKSIEEDPFAALLPANTTTDVGSWGIVESVGVFREVYLACFDLNEHEAADNWDSAFDRILRQESAKKGHLFDLYWHSNKRSEANIVATAFKLIPLFILTLVALAFFSMVATLWGDAVSSKPCLGFLGIVITGFAIMAAFGLMAWLQQPFVTIAIATPFLALAVGLDDMHVLLAGWRLTDRRLSVSRRMEETLREAGTSIFITFLTNMIGFIIGTYMPYPAIQKLSLFTTAAMCLDFGFQLTLFCSCLALFGRLEEKQRHSLLPCLTVSQPMITLKNSMWSAICCGSRHISEYTLIKSESGAATITTPLSLTPPTTSPSTSRSSSAGVDVEAAEGSYKTKVSSSKAPPPPSVNSEPETDNSAISDFFAKYYSPALLSRGGKFIVFLLYVGYLTRISFGISQLQVGFRAQNLFPRESTSYYWYLMIRGHFRSYWPQIPIIFTSQLDYANPNVQEELEELFQKFESSKFLWDRQVTRFWLLEYMPLYRQWTTNDTLLLNGSVPKFPTSEPTVDTTLPSDLSTALSTTTPYPKVMSSEEQFYSLLRTRFLKMPEYKFYDADVIWNWNETAIVRSRGWVVGKNLSNPDNERALLHAIRELIEGFRLGPIAAFSIDFILYEQHASIIYNCLYNVLIAIAAVLITSGVMAPYLSCMFWLAVCLISIVIGLFGFMSDCNIDLDSVSMVTIIIGVGFSTDFIAHFTYGYLIDEGKSTRAKADGALRDVGSATVPTAIGTIMSVLAMCSSTLYVYVVFFKMMSLTIALCALHSLVFLPVILSMLGPLPVTRREMNSNKLEKEREKERGIKVIIHNNSNNNNNQSRSKGGSQAKPPHKSRSEPNFLNGSNRGRSKSSSTTKEVQQSSGTPGARPVSDGVVLSSSASKSGGSDQRRQKRHLPPLPTSVSAVFTAAGGASGAATTASTTLSGGSASAGTEDRSTSDLSVPSSRRHFIVHEFGMTAKSAADRHYEATMLGANDADMQLDHPASSAEKVRAYLHQINRQKPTFTI